MSRSLPEGMTEEEYIARGDAMARGKALVDEWVELKRLGPEETKEKLAEHGDAPIETPLDGKSALDAIMGARNEAI